MKKDKKLMDFHLGTLNTTTMNTVDVMQKIKLVDGKFTPSEASDVLESLINEKINFHKIQRLRIWEGDHQCDTSRFDRRISELIEEKKVLKEFIAEAKREGANIEVRGKIEMSLVE